MAIVADLSGNSPPDVMSQGGVDQRLSIPNRQNAGSPVSSLTPRYSGELVLDTTNRVLWRAYGTTTTEWLPVQKKV